MVVLTPENFEETITKSPVPVLVDFYADWCGPCRAAAPTIEALAKEFEGKALVVKYDVDKGSELAMKYGVRGIPNFTVFVGGEVVTQVVGFTNDLDSKLRDALNSLLASK